MKKLSAIVFFTLFVLMSVAQTNTRVVKGFVRDADGMPLVGATVKAIGEEASTTSTQGGVFELRVSPYCQYVEALSEGYLRAKVEVDGSMLIFRLKIDKQYVENKVRAAAEEKARMEAIANAKAEAEARAQAEAKAEELARIDAAKRAEAERLAKEKAEAKAEEQARIDAAKRAEAERFAKEKAEAARVKAEEQARIDAAKRAEAERLAKEKAEVARVKAEEKAEAARVKAEEKAQLPALKNEEKIKKCIETNLRYWRNLQIIAPSDSYTVLGDQYLNGKGVSFNQANAFLCYNKGAEAGEALAYMRLAFFYETGRMLNKVYLESDTKMALLLYEKAASLGLTEAEAEANRLRTKR
ncbi:MAG: hypothetical protein E7130_06680 [Rikenellaceae bacterium]|nr:hypothetical protein [Rikenellaceae bacterium]